MRSAMIGHYDFMSILAKAPLLEAIFELHWGQVLRNNTGESQITFSNDEADLFYGQFKAVAEKIGFLTHERLQNPPIPHLVSHRFRCQPNSWPCYQAGLGIFTANQVNDGYSWETFKDSIRQGLQLLNDGHPSRLAGLPLPKAVLRYQDAFLLEANESAEGFLKSKMQVGFAPPAALMSNKVLGTKTKSARLEFALESFVPKGQLAISVYEALINGKPGIVMDTVVLSELSEQISVNIDGLSDWLEQAHDLQRHTFKTVIDPTFARTFE